MKRQHNFGATQNKGFYMTFENGWSISVQWGPRNYCDPVRDIDALGAVAHSAEIAIIQQPHCEAEQCTETWYDITKHDQVLGWQSPDEVAQWITKVQAWPTEL